MTIPTAFPIDVYEQSGLLTDRGLESYLNNKLQFVDKDYTIPNNVNNEALVVFNNDLNINDVVLIKTKIALKNDNGYYELI